MEVMLTNVDDVKVELFHYEKDSSLEAFDVVTLTVYSDGNVERIKLFAKPNRLDKFKVLEEENV